jgi:Flp pilus assembly protein TadD
MSLIIDALKKAQQLRFNASEGVPILKYPHPDKKKGRNFKKEWILIGAGLISLCILLFVLLRPASPPLATQPNRAIVLMETKPSVLLAEEISQEPTKKDQEPLPTGSSAEGYGPQAGQALNRTGSGQAGAERLPYVGAALSGRLPQSMGEKLSPETNPSLNQKKGESRIKELPEEEKLNPPKRVVTEKNLPPSPPASLKEEALSKSTGVEQEVEKDRPLASDILNQFNMGVYFYNQREISKAIQAYQKVIQMDPAYIEAYNNLGIIYQELGDFENALRSYQKSVEINPQYEKAYNNLGILFFLKDRYEEALEAFQKALATNPNNIESYINCGILFKKKGQWDKAIEFYKKALAINPLHGETHYNIALLYEQMENVELAIGHYQTFIQLSSRTHPELVSKVERHLNNLMKERKGK